MFTGFSHQSLIRRETYLDPCSVFVSSDPGLELTAHLPHPPPHRQEPVLRHPLQPGQAQPQPLHGEAGGECGVFPVELGELTHPCFCFYCVEQGCD